MDRVAPIPFAAGAAEIVTFPLDFIKTKTQSKVGSVTPRMVFTKNLSNPAVFYKGLTPALSRHVFYSTMRVSMYDKMRHDHGKLVSGLAAGSASQVLGTPFDVLKVRMQTYKKGKHTTMVKEVVDVVKRNGIKGLYKGFQPAVLRGGLANMGELATYDLSKQKIMKYTPFNDTLPTHFMAAVCSGFFSSLLSTPADVLKTRMMIKGGEKNMIKCVKGIAKNEGLVTFYKGFVPTWARLAPWQLTFWVSYEQLRRLTGVGGF